MTEKEKLLAIAKARARKAAAAEAPKGLTGIMGGVEQVGAGLNEGLSNFAGSPVDMAASVINGMVQRPQLQDLTDYSPADGSFPQPKAAWAGMSPGIETPVGGSQMVTDVMDPLISDRAPDNVVERYLRRAGQEAGFGIPAALTGASLTRFGAPAREAMTPFMSTSLAGDVGSAVAGQTSREIAPDNATADIVLSLLGGSGGAALASRFTAPTAPVQSIDDLRKAEAEKWGKVNADPSTLTDDATARLQAAVREKLPQRQTAAMRYPNATAAADDLDSLVRPRAVEVEDMRRSIGDTVASDPKEARIGAQMKAEISSYLDQLKPGDVVGDPSIVDDLTAARKLSAQGFKYDAVLNKEMRGETRAATTGTGGNEVNATKQNIRTLFDKERDPTLRGARQGFSPDEMAAMERVVLGDTKSNAARLFGRLSPTSGALGLTGGFGGAGGITAGLATGNPLMALAAVPPIVGMAAKTAAERMTQSNIDKLVATILNDGKAVGKSAARKAAERAIVEQLLSTSANGHPQ